MLLDGRPIRKPISGVARYCLSLGKALQQGRDRGVLDIPALELLVQREGGRNAEIAAIDPAIATTEMTRFGSSRKTQNLMTEFAPRIAGRLALRRYDLVHETYFADIGAVGSRQRKVATIHDVIPLDFPEYFSKANAFFSGRSFRRQTRHTDAIIAVSAYTRQRILELSDYPADRVHVIGCGVDTADAALAADAVWPIAGKLAAGSRYMLYIGNIEPRKNLDTLIDAWATLGDSHRDVMLVVAGKRNFQADATLARGHALLGDRFAYLGPVSEADKWGLLAHAQALVLPSLYEGYGIPIIEAYATGTPALFARNSSMVELAFDDRQMFDARSVAETAAAIAGLLDGPAWVDTVRERARAFVATNGWDDVARSAAGVYRSVLAR